MNRKALVYSFVLATSAVFAGEKFPSLVWQDGFTMTFEDYHIGESLSDQGAVGGSWGARPVPSEAAATVQEDASESQFLAFTTESENLVFTPDAGNNRWAKLHLYRMRFPEADSPLTLDSDAKASFMVLKNPGAGSSFVGYTGSGWTNLVSSTVTAASETWYDLATVFRKSPTGEFRVSYGVKTPSGDYEILRSADGADMFPLGGDGTISVKKIEVWGDGYLGDFSGFMQTGFSLRIRSRESASEN